MRIRSGTFGYFYKAVVLSVAAGLVGASPSFSAGTTVAVSGDSKPSECGSAKKATYSTELTGNLTGCWAAFVSHFNCQEINGFALYTEIGREEFEGKLDGQDTKFDTTYTFTGVFPSKSCPEPVAQRKSSAVASLLSGTRLVGVIRFYDVMYGEGAPHYFYEGTLSKS